MPIDIIDTLKRKDQVDNGPVLPVVAVVQVEGLALILAEIARQLASDESSAVENLATQQQHTKQIGSNTASIVTNTEVLTTHTANLANPHFVTRAQVGLGNADNTSDANKPVSAAVSTALAGKEATGVAAAQLLLLRDGVTNTADTLQKLYNLVQLRAVQYNVANQAARNALNVSVGAWVNVDDDGDGRWAIYRATSAGVNASYNKVSDPDLLNAVMSAAQIKAAYESNADTNAFTNTLLTKLAGIAANATANSTDAQLLSAAASAAGSASKEASTITGLGNLATQNGTFSGTSAGANTGDQNVPGTPLAGYALAQVNALILPTDTVIQAFGKLQKQLKDSILAVEQVKGAGVALGVLPGQNSYTLKSTASGTNESLSVTGFTGLVLGAYSELRVNSANTGDTFTGFLSGNSGNSSTYSLLLNGVATNVLVIPDGAYAPASAQTTVFTFRVIQTPDSGVWTMLLFINTLL